MIRTILLNTAALVALAACQSGTPAFEDASSAQTDPPTFAPADLAISNVTVIDVVAGTAVPGQTVLISGDTITTVAPSALIRYAANETIDATGQYLIPGLIDMHVHIDAAGLPAFPLNGVTTVRDMGTQTGPLAADKAILQARAAVASGDLFGPEIFTAALILDGPVDRNPQWAPHYRSVESVDQANEIVDGLAALDVDFIKVYSALEPDIYEAVAARAEGHGLNFAGHVPESVGVEEAVLRGQTTIEHQRGVFVDISREEDAIRAEFVAAVADRNPSGGYQLRQQMSDRLISTSDPEKAARLFNLMAERDVAAVPTLTVLSDPRWSDPDAAVPEEIVARFSPIYQRIVAGGGPPEAYYADLDQARRHYAAYADITRQMYEAGVPILAGTDAANPYAVPGWSLHTELELLVEAGLPEEAALRAATSEAARFLDAEGRLGQVSTGSEADLVILNSNPLADISATTDISHVIMNGDAFTPTEIDALWKQ